MQAVQRHPVPTDAVRSPCRVATLTPTLAGAGQARRPPAGQLPGHRVHSPSPSDSPRPPAAVNMSLPIARLRENRQPRCVARPYCSTAEFNNVRHGYSSYGHCRKEPTSAVFPPIRSELRRRLGRLASASVEKPVESPRSDSLRTRPFARSRSCVSGRAAAGFGGRDDVNARAIRGYRVLGNTMTRRLMTRPTAHVRFFGEPPYRTVGELMASKRDGLADKLCTILDAEVDGLVAPLSGQVGDCAARLKSGVSGKSSSRIATDKRVRFSDEVTFDHPPPPPPPPLVTTYAMTSHCSGTPTIDLENGMFVLTRKNIELFEYLMASEDESAAKCDKRRQSQQRVLDWVLQQQLHRQYEGTHSTTEEQQK